MRVLAVAVLVAAVVSSAGCAVQSPPPVSEKIQKAYETGLTPTLRPTAKAVPIKFSMGTKTLVFGDSWTSGLYMDPETQGFTYRATDTLGLDAEILGGNGTGYLNAGINKLGAYGERMKKLPVSDAKLLIIQGSVNDLGRDITDLGPAFDATIAIAKTKFPKAQIVILGPSTAQWPAQAGLYRVDDVLGERAANAGLAYISPYGESWINGDNFAAMIDPKTGHPSEAGHAYLASKLVAAMKARQAK